MNPTAHKPRSAKWMLALIAVITTLCFAGASSSETTKKDVRPPDQWTWFPEFSPDRKKVAVNWPAPPIIDKDGKLTRVYGKFVKGFSSQMLPTNLAATKRTSPVMLSNLEYQQSIIVDSRTYELLATLPKRLSNVEWSPNGKLLLGNPFSSDNITVFDASTGKELSEIPNKNFGYFGNRCSWSADSAEIATIESTGVFVWNALNGKKRLELPGEFGYRNVVA